MPGDPRYAGIRRKLQEIRDQETKRLEKAITAARVAVRQRITENVMISMRFTLYHRFVRVPDYAVRSSVRCGACASFCASRARSMIFAPASRKRRLRRYPSQDVAPAMVIRTSFR